MKFQITWTKKLTGKFLRRLHFSYEVWGTFKTDNEYEKSGYLNEIDSGTACDETDGDDVESTKQYSPGDIGFDRENEYDVDLLDNPSPNKC